MHKINISSVTHKKILFIGSFLSSHIGVKGTSEILAEMLDINGWESITTSRQLSRVFRIIDMLYTAWKNRNKYSIAHMDVFSGFAFWWAEVLSIFISIMKKPLILTLRGGGLPAFAHHNSKRVSRLLGRADFITTPSHFILKDFFHFQKDILYLPNGINLQNYIYKLRNEVCADICWLRAFHEIYNPVLAVEVIALLKPKYPDIRLTMIGPDKHDGTHQNVLELIQQKGLSANITLTGPVSKQDVPTRLGEHDIFINTTRVESFGVGVMEAAAVGLPIITTNVGELPLLWTHEQDALLVPKDDPVAMACAVERVLTEKDLAARLTANARKKAEEHDWPVIVSRWEQLFYEVQNRETQECC
jgi:glycosyltransferase involved in cell wall biosynthesis